MPNSKPIEYWKVVIYESDCKSEKIFCGKGGRKRALQYASMARKRKEGIFKTEVLACLPKWESVEVWRSDAPIRL